MSGNINSRFRRFLNSLLVFIFCLLIFFLGFKTSDSGYYDDVIRPRLKDAVLPVINVFKSKPKEIVLIDIRISDKDFERISEIRKKAVADGVFLEGKDEWFQGEMQWSDTIIPVELRLKGGLLDHLLNDRWSFRIRTDSSVFGLTRFSIQHPNTRNFVYERILHQIARSEGLIALEYDFLNITINHKLGGLYAVEENFGKDLLKRNDRRSGPILKFDDEERIAWLAHEKKLHVDTMVDLPNFYLNAGIDVYDAEFWSGNDSTRAIVDRAVELLNGFRNGRYISSETFNVGQLAKLFALADLLGAQHCTDWRNMRFYYNGTSDLLEPIVYDGNAGERISAIRALREQGPIIFDPTTTENFYGRLFSDQQFYMAYISELERLSEGEKLDQLLTPIERDIEEQVDLLNTEFPNFKYEKSIFEDCKETINYTVSPPKAIHAYLENNSEKELLLQIGLTQDLPVEVIKVKSSKYEWVPSEPYLILPSDSSNRAYRFYSLGHLHNDALKMEVHYRMLGSERVRTERVRPYSSGLSDEPK